MLRSRSRAALLLALVSCSEAVHPVDGTWVGSDRFGAYVLKLRQDGEDITGVACRMSGGRRIFADVPVSGDYPRLAFDPPSVGGAAQFQITVEGVDSLSGTVNPSGFVNGPVLAYTFTRTRPELYDECAAAPS